MRSFWCAITRIIITTKMSSKNQFSMPVKDPWRRFEAWRYAPEINRAANKRNMFPGLGIGFGVFLVLVAVEEFYWKPNHPDDSGHH